MIVKPTGSYGWIDKYIAKSNDENLIEGLKRQTSETLTLLSSLTDEQWKHSYAPGKWQQQFRDIALNTPDDQPYPVL